MDNPITESGAVLDGTFLKSRECFLTVCNLRQKQLEQVVSDYSLGVLTNIGNIGWVPPQNIVNYYCPNCSIKYDESPSMQIRVKEDTSLIYCELLCNHCNDLVSIVLVHKDEDELIDKKLITFDDTGKYIPYTKEFIDKRISAEVASYNTSPHLIFRLDHWLKTWISRAKDIEYKVDAKKVYETIKKESIKETISMFGSHDLRDEVDKAYNILTNILNERSNNAELLTLLKEKYDYYNSHKKEIEDRLAADDELAMEELSFMTGRSRDY